MKKLRLVAAFLLCIMLTSCANKTTQEATSTEETHAPAYTTLQLTESALHTGSLILVNAAHRYDDAQAVLTSVWEGKTDRYFIKATDMVIDPVALSALNEWMDAAFANSGVTDVNIISSFRSEAEQQSLYDNALQSKGQAYADNFFMRPGYSEHHTGLALDLSLYDTETGLSADFPGSASQQWAAEHACDFGFIQRYPVSKSSITGIDFESWHYRYVGIPHACYIYQNQLCLEEYIELLRSYPYTGEHLFILCNSKNYEIWYCEGLEVTVPTDRGYDISGNNEDGFIVTVTQP